MGLPSLLASCAALLVPVVEEVEEDTEEDTEDVADEELPADDPTLEDPALLELLGVELDALLLTALLTLELELEVASLPPPPEQACRTSSRVSPGI